MGKTFEVTNNYPFTGKHIKAFENGGRVLDIDIEDGDVDCAIKILRALGYQLLYRASDKGGYYG